MMKESSFNEPQGGVLMVNNHPSEPKDITPVNDTLEDLLNNPFSTPTDKLTQTQQNEINALQE